MQLSKQNFPFFEMKSKSCKICNNREANYKCPKCRIAYCSVNCYKSHKKDECKLTEENSDIVESLPKSYRYQTEDTIPQEKLRLLGESKALVDILQNTPLRDLIKVVDESSDPSRTIQMAMQDNDFVQFVDECLRIVEPNS